ncbi:MAG: hypothetical protein Q4E69_03615 [Bacilli bacterium]|nr:hypothetical protein [Bacilli bacterium]
MKKIIVLLLVLVLVTGCRNNNSNIVNKFNKKIKNLDSYYLSGDLELRNNDEVYNYDVEVSYENKKYYKVSLKNKANDSTQVILKNDDGVFILTPSLNRSFKFQSDWPYNNSQVYLLKAISRDIIEDSDYSFSESKKYYTIRTKVNYPNNKDLVKQKIILNKKLNLVKVIVYNKDDIPEMEFKVKKIDYSPSFKKDYFNINTIMNTFNENIEVKETMTLEDTIYPLSLPTGTNLTNEEKIKKTNGERVLMTFEGDKPFLLVEETANREEEFTIIPTNGVPYQLMDTLGVMTDNSLNWSSNGIEYYLVSDVLSSDELVTIAESIYALPTMK